jgi:hypothetical protein
VFAVEYDQGYETMRKNESPIFVAISVTTEESNCSNFIMDQHCPCLPSSKTVRKFTVCTREMTSRENPGTGECIIRHGCTNVKRLERIVTK